MRQDFCNPFGPIVAASAPDEASTWTVIAVWIISAGPLLALLFALADRTSGQRFARRGIRATLAFVAICVVALFGELAQSGRVAEVVMMRWAHLHGRFLELFSLRETLITFGARCDGVALCFVGLLALVLWPVLDRWPLDRPLGWLMLSWMGATDLVTATNLGQIVWGWCLSGWAASELARPADRDANSTYRPVWLVQRVSEIALLICVYLVWTHWKGLSLPTGIVDPQNPIPHGIPESVALSVLIAAIVRCGQVPLSVWLETEAGFAATENRSVVGLSNEMVGMWNVPDGHQVAERLQADPASRWHRPPPDSVPLPVLAWWICGVFLPMGICLLVRFESVLVQAHNARLLMLVVGSFTMLIASASAVAQNSWPRVFSQIAVAYCGFVFVTLSLDHSAAVAFALALLLVHCLLLSVLIVAGDRLSGDRSVANLADTRIGWIAALILVSGLWGRHVVADVVWQLASDLGTARLSDEQQDNVALGGTLAHMLPLAVWLMCAAELLLSLALFRAIFKQRTLPAENEWRESRSTAPDRLPVSAIALLSVAVFGGLWLGLTPGHWTSAFENTSRTTLVATTDNVPALWGVGSLVPLSCAGAVLAWWLYSRPSSLPDRLAQLFGPFARLSRNRFYWDDLYFLLFTKPLLTVSSFLAWFDRAGAEADHKLRDQILESTSAVAEPLSDGDSSVYALTTFSVVTLLAWMLLWLR